MSLYAFAHIWNYAINITLAGLSFTYVKMKFKQNKEKRGE
jgi:hypothetical protein